MRVIAGRFGGRRLVAPRGLATRPTSDRVREALFSALGPLHDARVLDLYAGTGALGLEALSRGAASVLFVENAAHALTALRANIAALGVEPSEARVLAIPAERALSEIAKSAPFDLVVVDPPYAEANAAILRLAPTLAKAASPGARLVLEHASRTDAPALASFEQGAPRVYGDTSITIYRREA